MKANLKEVKFQIENYASESNLSELEVIDKLKDYYFNKEVTKNLNFYKKKNKKVREITKDLKISHRKFYALLEKKNIEFKKYKRASDKVD
ncbi:hypothetical protein [Psychroserpens sp.]